MNTSGTETDVSRDIGRTRADLRFGVLTLVALTLAACSEPPPETRLESVSDALNESTAELADLETRIERTEALLDRLKAERRAQRDEVRTLEQRLDARATDVALFRAVQAALLEDAQLQDAAIAVSVEDGIVTISGMVSTPEQLRHAIAVSRSVPGLDQVVSKVRLNDAGASESDDA